MEQNIKHILLQKVMQVLDDKIRVLQESIESAKESRDSDAKSSVGDKYETSRAMMHIEIDKNETQLRAIAKQRNEISKINTNATSNKVEFGSVVYTSNGNYFVSIATGKIEAEGKVFYSISLASPIGKLLKDKKEGENIVFQGKSNNINKII